MKVSDQYKEIIFGSLLGDGSLKIHKPYKNARFSFRHSICQKEYFFWKVKRLKEISSENCFWEQKNDGWSKKNKLRYQSLTKDYLTKLYRLVCPEGSLCIRRKWLKLLTPLSLVVWWLDDGSLVGNGRKGVFCSEGFDYKDLMVLSRYLRNTWKIRTKVGRRGKYYQLRISSTEELKKFLRLILPHFSVTNMLPKVILLYRDPQLQQRWISEVCQLTKFSHRIVEKYLVEKKKKWKNFRE
jgi:recombination protein RecA